jgi:uncharacterized protein
MKLSLDYSTAKYAINAYDEGAITVNNQRYTNGIVVTPDRLLDMWEPKQVAQLDLSHIEYLISLEPEIILLGTGKVLCFPHPSLSALALQQGIGFEVMDTGSACRTYNVLAAEDRNIAAALMIHSSE